MKKILVLGIGNQLMMDDGVGIYLVEELMRRDHLPSIQYLIGESDIDYCLEKIEEAELVIIIDALLSGKEPGELAVYSIADLHEHPFLDISSHNLHLFQFLYHQKKEIKGFLVGVEPFEINFHIGLSQPLKSRWDTTLNGIEKIIKKLITIDCRI